MPVLREIGLVTMELERTRVALIAQLPGPQPAFEQKPGSICLAHDMVPEFHATRIVDRRRVEAISKCDGLFACHNELLEEPCLVQVGHFGGYCAPAHEDFAMHERDIVGWPWISHSRVWRAATLGPRGCGLVSASAACMAG